jgi:pyruvate/2-oxoglutarate dehydrogenase complex dihydrolipoamide dehydrogenase (E3) component
MPDYDAIIIGTGQSGPALARRLVAAGRNVAIIERKLFGGCAYRKSNPDIFVMQSAEDRAAKNTPRPHYGAR